MYKSFNLFIYCYKFLCTFSNFIKPEIIQADKL